MIQELHGERLRVLEDRVRTMENRNRALEEKVDELGKALEWF